MATKKWEEGIDYSVEIEKAKAAGLDTTALEEARAAKIADKYGGVEPTMYGSNQTYSQASTSGNSSAISNAVNLYNQYTGKTTTTKDPYAGTNYHQDAIDAAIAGDWDAVVDALRIPYCTDCTIDLQAKESLRSLRAEAYILAHNSTEQEIGRLIDKNVDNMLAKLALVEQQVDSWMTMEVLAAKVMAYTGADLENTAKVLGMQRNIQVLMNHLIETGRITHRVTEGYIEYCRA